MIDSISKMCANLNNAALGRRKTAKILSSNSVVNILRMLMAKGFILSFEIDTNCPGYLVVYINNGYLNNTRLRMKRVSTPGHRVYSSYRKLAKIYPDFIHSGHHKIILSTCKGFLFLEDAIRLKIGGEVVAKASFI